MTNQAPASLEVVSPEPVGRVWLALFSLSWFGFWLLVMLPGQFMLVKLADVLDPVNKVTIGSLLIAEMSVVILIGVPAIGWLCDRSQPRFGRRRSWALGGFLLSTLAFAGVGVQTSWPPAALLLALVALGEAAVLVSLSAVIADRVPPDQRGRASAAMGVPQVIALAVGMVIVTDLVPDVGQSWMVIAALALVSPLPFLLAYAEPRSLRTPPLPRHAWRWNPILVEKYRNLGWAGLSRVLINAGNLLGTTYLLYFLSDVLRRPDPDGSLLVLTLIYLVASGLASWLGGLLTDRLDLRRQFVAVFAGFQVVAALLLALTPSWPASIAAACLLGIGYGGFLSVDQALLTDVLPDDRTRARDLGVVNSAQHLPIAPLVGWAVLTFSGHAALYGAAAVIMAIGGMVVFRVQLGTRNAASVKTCQSGEMP